MNPSASDQPASANVEPVLSNAEIAAVPVTATAAASTHPDPITGEPGAHPVGVGVGALGAGAAGAAIGALAGPVGAVIGAVIGAVAGGLAGKEVATTAEETALNSGDFTPIGEESTTSRGSTTAFDEKPISTVGEPGFAPAFSSFSTPESEPEPSYTPRSATATGLVAPSPSPEAAPSDAATSASPVWPDDDKAAYQINSDVQPATPELAHSSFETDDANPEETVRTTAYYRYLARQQSGSPGDELQDWVEAEKIALH